MMRRSVFLLMAALCVLAICGSAYASGVDQNNTNLPPQGVYLSPDQVHAMYSGPSLAIVMSAIQHQPFQQPPPLVIYKPEGEDHTFHSGLEGQISVNGSPNQGTSANGQVHTIAYGRTPSNQLGTFQTEMLGMDLSGSSPFGPYMIRESPTLASLGQTTVSDIGGGMYHIDSFFDVFTELSIDGGNSWMPSAGSTHVVLGIPEPATVTLLGLALVGFVGLSRRHR